jgi:hypothetical protein
MNPVNLDSLTFDELSPTDSKYLRKEDVGPSGMILTVKGFTRAELDADDGTKKVKTILHFLEDVKPMVLGSTTSLQLGEATGATTAGGAKGQKIVVFNDHTIMFGKKRTGGLRIRAVSAAASAAPPAPAAAAHEINDDIPF